MSQLEKNNYISMEYFYFQMYQNSCNVTSSNKKFPNLEQIYHFDYYYLLSRLIEFEKWIWNFPIISTPYRWLAFFSFPATAIHQGFVSVMCHSVSFHKIAIDWNSSRKKIVKWLHFAIWRKKNMRNYLQ